MHETLHKLYKGFAGKELKARMIAGIKSRLDPAVDEACNKEFSGRDVKFGRNLLLVRVAKIMVRRFLESEIRTIASLKESGETISIVGLEQHLERPLELHAGSETLNVRIRGFADRIDTIGRYLRIIDYKTGSTDKKRTSVKDWDMFPADPASDHAFQLLTYSWLYFPRIKAGSSIQAGIMSLRKINDGLLAVSVPSSEEGKVRTNITSLDLNEFERTLKQVLGSVFNTDEKFSQTSDLKICSRCPYVDLCGR